MIYVFCNCNFLSCVLSLTAFLPVYLCEFVGILSCTLCFIGGVAQGEDDWSLIQRAHRFDDIMCEESPCPRHACEYYSRLEHACSSYPRTGTHISSNKHLQQLTHVMPLPFRSLVAREGILFRFQDSRSVRSQTCDMK